MEDPITVHKIPQTDSIREMADFCDTHDLTDFEDQLEEVTEPVFVRQKVVQIHLPTRDAETAASTARSQGLSSADLIRTWIREKVQTPS